MGPWPTEHYDPNSLFWKHERLHRRAILDFECTVPEIRADFDLIETEFLTEAESVLSRSKEEKREFVEHCFYSAMVATEKWIKRLESKPISYPNNPFGEMWKKYNRSAIFDT
jgi:hypothetical protein